MQEQRRVIESKHEILSYLTDSFNPSSLVDILNAHDRRFGGVPVSIKKEQMVCKHEHQPAWNQNQIQILLGEDHVFLPLCF